MKKILLWIIFVVLLAGSCCGVYFGVKYYDNKELSQEDNSGNLKLVEELRDNITLLEAEKSELSLSLVTLNSEFAKVEAEKNSYKEQIKANNETIEANNARIAELEAQGEESTTLITELQAQNDLLRTSNLDYASAVERLTNEKAELNSQITNLQLQISEKESEILNLQSQILYYQENYIAPDLIPVDIVLTAEQVNEQITTLDGVTTSLKACFIGSTAGKFKSVKEAYIRGNTLIILANFGYAVSSIEGSRIGYAEFKFEEGLLTAEYIQGALFFERFKDSALTNFASIMELSYSACFVGVEAYQDESLASNELSIYLNSNLDSKYIVFDKEYSINDLYYSINVFSFGSLNKDYVHVSLLTYKNGNLTIYKDMCVCSRADAVLGDGSYMSDEQLYILYLDSIKVEEPLVYSRIFSENTPEQISAVSAKISEDGLTSAEVAETYGWNIGDTTTITLTTGEVIEMRIIGFNHDDKSDGTGKAGITLEMTHCLATKYQMNSTGTNKGGYAVSKMRTETLPTIKETLPEEWQSVIKMVDKKSANGGGSNYTEILTLSEDLFLLSAIETCQAGSAQAKDTEGFKYEYWVSNNSNNAKQFDSDKNGILDTFISYWFRSCANGSTSEFSCVNSNANGVTFDATRSFGVSFAFCV